MRFAIRIVDRGRYLALRGFDDFVRALGGALRDLGHEVGPGPGARPFLFGACNLRSWREIPRDAIIFNAEQVISGGVPPALDFEQLRRRAVWDYAEANVAWFRERGVPAILCPVGYHPAMVRALPSIEEDVDVLHYGALNPRRQEVLGAIEATGLRVVRLLGVFGEERDRWIVRSKIVLNLHFYEHPVFEIFRVSHLLANDRCVVTEAGGADGALEGLAQRTCRLVSRERLVETCQELVRDEAARREQAEQGRCVFREETNLVEGVRRALQA